MTRNSLQEPGSTPINEMPSIFATGGEMARLCRKADWAATPLGPVDSWPQSLKTTVATVLRSGFPMILVWGPELIQIYNDAYAPLIGRKHAAALAMPTHECWPEIRHLQEPVFRRVFSGETVDLVEAHYPLARNGVVEDCYFDATFVPVSMETGEIGGSLSTLFEVTSRVTARTLEAEREKFQLILEHSNDAHGLFDPEGRLLWANRCMSKRLGYTREELRTLTVPDINPQVSLARYQELFERARRERVPPFESVHRRKDGTTFPVEITPTAVELAEGVRMSSAVRDITERKQSEAALRDAKRVAEQASEAKSQFLAVMSHELRTPLTAVIGHTDLLESEVFGPVTAKQQEALARIKASSWHLVAIIDEILTLSRAEAGKEEVRWAAVDLAEITQDVIGITEPKASADGLVLRLESADEPLPAWTDPGKVRQIVINLVGNAIKYTRQGEVTVQVNDSASEWLQIHVRDTGPGIAPEDQERVFEAFTQLDSSLTRGGEGTGLGLAICRRLARLLGGEIMLQSTPGEGSTFTLRLPRQQQEAS